MESETTTFDIDDAWDSFIAPSQVTDDNYNVLETMITNCTKYMVTSRKEDSTESRT